jgi:hypothetical protein
MPLGRQQRTTIHPEDHDRAVPHRPRGTPAECARQAGIRQNPSPNVEPTERHPSHPESLARQAQLVSVTRYLLPSTFLLLGKKIPLKACTCRADIRNSLVSAWHDSCHFMRHPTDRSRRSTQGQADEHNSRDAHTNWNNQRSQFGNDFVAV